MQRYNLSLELFNINIDKIIEALKTRDLGYRVGNHYVNITCHAVDAVLMAESEDDLWLQRPLYTFKLTKKNLI